MATLLGSATLCGLTSTAAASTSPTRLLVPQGSAFRILGHDCGGIQEKAYATGFDASLDPLAGYPIGDVYIWTVCNGSGRGGHSITYSAWTSDTWDLTGALLSVSQLPSAPAVDPSFTATDALTGNQLYNTTNFHCTTQSGALPNACLQLAPTFTPRPRVTSISVVQGPSTGGTIVTISGDGLTAVRAVDFGSTPAASYTVASDNSITAISPPETPGGVTISVTSAGGTDFPIPGDQFTFYGRPTITKVSPNHGPMAGGYYVTVTGTHLMGATKVMDGDTQTGFQVVSDTSMSVYIIPGESLGDSMDIVVTTPGGTSAVTGADQFTYENSAVASISLSRTKARPGSTIRVTGVSFASNEKVKVVYATGKASPKQVTLCTGTTSDTGGFSCAGRIPSRAKAGRLGSHVITATGATGDVASAPVKLT